jgi:acetyl esterase/lipase
VSSAETKQFEEFLDGITGRFAQVAQAGQGLDMMREIAEGLHRAGAEPEGVTYAEVDVNGVPALWAIPEGASSEHAIVWFHFGGSVVASMYTDRKAAGHVAKAAGVRALVVDFRLAPENKYPAQINDAVTAFEWLVAQGYAPEKIGSVGHSIGGNLAVTLPLTLRDKGRPLPGAIVAISPWIDPTMSHPDYADKGGITDRLLNKDLGEFFRESWIGGTEVSPSDPQINLMQADLTGLPPISLHWGTYEVLNGECNWFAERLQKEGIESQSRPLEGAQHSFVIAGGKVPEVDAEIQAMGRWLRDKLGVK